MKAVIMAGGAGTRLRPLTCGCPKPLVPVLNLPVMSYLVSHLKCSGINEIAVTLQYLPEAITRYFGDGSDFGVRLSYYRESVPLGTAGGVKNAAPFLDETFLVMSGDALTDFPFTEALDFHKRTGALVTIVLTRTTNPLEYGLVITEKSGKILKFVEKPGWGEVFSDTVNTGIYILEPEVLDYVPAGVPFDFSRDLFPLLLRERKPLFGFIASGYWCDIGDLDQYRQTNFDFLTGRVNLPLPYSARETGLWIGSNVDVHPRAQLIPPVLIGNNCYLGANVKLGPGVVLGNYSVVQAGASVKYSIFWDHSYLDEEVEIRGAILCDHVRVKSKTAVFENAVVGSYSRLGPKSILKPGVKIWPGTVIGEGQIREYSSSHRRDFSIRKQGEGKAISLPAAADLAARLGAAYGSSLPFGKSIVLASDGHPLSQLIKRVLAASILCAGINVIEIGAVSYPVAGYGVKATGAVGGVYLAHPGDSDDEILVYFLNARGANLEDAELLRIEEATWRGEFRRVNILQLGRFTYLPYMKDAYNKRRKGEGRLSAL
ncbi:MAG: sugar phosphate nucleotidyltransferase [Bacillota bacterium]|nr:sugar phosphate nucleotidyltransferase [Bacillota bacterium]